MGDVVGAVHLIEALDRRTVIAFTADEEPRPVDDDGGVVIALLRLLGEGARAIEQLTDLGHGKGAKECELCGPGVVPGEFMSHRDGVDLEPIVLRVEGGRVPLPMVTWQRRPTQGHPGRLSGTMSNNHAFLRDPRQAGHRTGPMPT